MNCPTMDPISQQLYMGVKRGFGLISILVLILINWEPMSELNILEQGSLETLYQYKDAMGDYLISSQWPILSLVCYLSTIHDLLYLRRRLLSTKVYLASRCGFTLFSCIIFGLVSLYKWFWLTIGLGIPSLEMEIFRPDFASIAIIIITSCFNYYVAGACEMKEIYLRLVADVKKKHIPFEATTAV